MSPTAQGSIPTGGRKRLLTVISQAVQQLRDGRGSSAKQILAWVEKNPTVLKQLDEARLKHTLKKGVETGVLTCRAGRYKLAARDDRELCCRRRRRRSCRRRRRSCRRRRRRSCRRRRRSCRRRRRSCRRRRRRSCRRRRRSCRRRRRRSCRRRRRRRPSCCPRPPRRRRSCRRRRRRCSSDPEAVSLASVDVPGGQNPAGPGQPPQHAPQQN